MRQYTEHLGLRSRAGVARARPANKIRGLCERVLIADPNENWRNWTARKFAAAGIGASEAGTLHELCSTARTTCPDIVITELNLPDGTWLDALVAMQTSVPAARVVIVTSTGSIASAVEAVKAGAVGYLSKPTTVEHILHTADFARGVAEESKPESMSLDRAIWEYLTQTVVACGTIAGAARELGLDRRSLRRMLAKNPPPR